MVASIFWRKKKKNDEPAAVFRKREAGDGFFGKLNR
jgi:hypothetical protein